MEKYIIAIDQSTSGTKLLLVNEKADIIYKAEKSHKQYYPQPGWVEHDPVEIYQNILALVKTCLDTNNLNDQALGIAITNQRETIVLWDSETGKPVYNAIVWQCRRTADYCTDLIKNGKEEMIHSKTGLKVDPYFSASKLNWMIENVAGMKEKAKAGKLMAGTIDSWIIWNLTDKKTYKTDITNASRTLLFDIYKHDWDKELIGIFGLEGIALPEVDSCNGNFGSTTFNGYLQNEIPITSVIGDSQGALFAQKCYEKGMAKITYGTGTSIMMFTKEQAVKSEKGLVTAIAWALDNKVEYALEGIINCSGDIINWLKSNMDLFDNYDELNQLAQSIPENEGVYLVPALVGYGIPYWDPYAKAALVGMTRGTKKAHVLRAGLEAIAYQVFDAVAVMESAASIQITCLKADGGATTNEFLMQFQSDILAKDVISSDVNELSAMGSIYISGLKLGIWKDIEQLNKEAAIYRKKMDKATRDKNIEGWEKALKMILE